MFFLVWSNFSGLHILTSLKAEAAKVFSPVFDDSVIKEWVEDKLDAGIRHLNTLEPRLEELRKIAAGKEGKQ